VCEEQF